MKKIFISIVLFAICIFGLTACSENENYDDYQPSQGSMFVCVESYKDPYLDEVKILVDKETMIMYIYSKGFDGTTAFSCMTVIYDENGMPKKYQGVISE